MASELTDEQWSKMSRGERLTFPGHPWRGMAREMLISRRQLETIRNGWIGWCPAILAERELIAEGVLDDDLH